MKRAYLDHNATTPVRPEVADAMAHALRLDGNPSSVHAEGRAARKLVEEARTAVANLLQASPRDIIFTSGGTEAANLALHAAKASLGIDRFIISAIEHPCVATTVHASGLPVDIVAVDANGVVDLGALEKLCAMPGKALVALMLANNETGVIQPVAETAKIAHAAGHYLLTDTVQAVGKIAIDVLALDADMAILSAHKFGGPQGVGALYVRDGLSVEAMIKGSGQELRRRAGTENVPGIAGLGVAARLANDHLLEMKSLSRLRDDFESRMRIAAADLVVFGGDVSRLANTSYVSAPGLDAQALLMALDLDGIAVSSGSACSSGKVERSHVLAAMGIDADLARGAIRVSLGYKTTENELVRLVESWSRFRARMQSRASSASLATMEA